MKKKIDADLFDSSPQDSGEPCPECQHTLVLKYGKHGPFWACSNFPACDYLKPLHQNDGHIVKHLAVPCPECDSELVLRQGRYGMFIGCSDYPQCHYHQSPKSAAQQDADDEQFLCPECQQGHLVARQNRFGKRFYSCSCYPDCKFTLNAQPVAGECQACGHTLLTKLKSGKFQCALKRCHHQQEQAN